MGFELFVTQTAQYPKSVTLQCSVMSLLSYFKLFLIKYLHFLTH